MDNSILDSGNRTEFSTGAVRDIQDDKGRCDLLPLDVVAKFFEGNEREVFILLDRFESTGDINYLRLAIEVFALSQGRTIPDLMLEVSIHYRDGAIKYKSNNWKLGIPISLYISSGVRHLLKHIDGQTDERHDRAFVWNIMGAIWTKEHKTEMVDIPFNC